MFGSFEQGSALIRCVLLGNLLQKELRGEAASLMGEILLCGGGGGSDVLSWGKEGESSAVGLKWRAWVGFSKQKQRPPAGSKVLRARR